jgi:hypothetical protein
LLRRCCHFLLLFDFDLLAVRHGSFLLVTG